VFQKLTPLKNPYFSIKSYWYRIGKLSRD